MISELLKTIRHSKPTKLRIIKSGNEQEEAELSDEDEDWLKAVQNG